MGFDRDEDLRKHRGMIVRKALAEELPAQMQVRRMKKSHASAPPGSTALG